MSEWKGIHLIAFHGMTSAEFIEICKEIEISILDAVEIKEIVKQLFVPETAISSPIQTHLPNSFKQPKIAVEKNQQVLNHKEEALKLVAQQRKKSLYANKSQLAAIPEKTRSEVSKFFRLFNIPCIA